MTWYEPEDLGPEQDARDRAYGRRRYWTYVLHTDYGSYVGHTGNIMRRLRAHEAGEVESTLGAEINGAWYSDPLPTREDAAKFEAALKSLRDSRSPLFTEYTTGLPPVPWRGWNARVDEPVVSERYSSVLYLKLVA